jgi:tetratricopeptide (TPR) repeat protein
MKRLVPFLVLVCACQGPGPEPQPPADEPEAPVAQPQVAEPAPAGADASKAEAATLLAAGDPYQALALLDEVHVVAPDDANAWYLRGKAALAAAGLGQSAADFYLDAQSAFERAASLGHGPDALLGASRAARMNLEPERALELAREALALVEQSDPPPQLEQPLEGTLIEALFGLYVARRQAGEDAPELYAETEERLTAMTRGGREDSYGDLWAWTQLANLYQWGGQADLASQAQERAVAITPDDAAAHARLVDLARAAGGSEAVLAAYERFEAAHPDSALAAWYRGVETFNLAVAALHGDEESVALFETAEALLVRCRRLEPSLESSCKGYEVMCRNGVGWARYGQGDLEGAKAAFLSMEEVFPGGIDWQIEGSLMSGVAGLQFVADKYAQRAPGEFDLEGKPEAAAVFDLLHELRPADPDFANNAGLFNRDVCVILELEAGARLERADGWGWERNSGEDVPIEEARYERVRVEVSPEEAETLRAEAATLRAQASEHAQKSYHAYQAAARLSPDDVRVVNDAALVMVYHIRRDVDEMEGLLTRAIGMGAEQITDPELSPEELDALLEAWGDAHQNLGLVYLTLKDDPATARTWFERAFEIGPRPRVDRAWIEQRALPACDKAVAGEEDALEGLDPRLWLHVGP